MADLRVVHEQDETLGEDGDTNRQVLATNVTVADSLLSTGRGLMFRSTLPDEFALVMEVGGDTLSPFTDGPPRQLVHMLFVRMPLDVIWLDDSEVVQVSQLQPWRGIGMARADRILELPAGNADGVSVGDRVVVEDADGVSLGAE
jgi:uncharacterized membrane protein (UPF0127 family)